MSCAVVVMLEARMILESQESFKGHLSFEFERFENKFLLPKFYQDEFYALLEQHMDPIYLDKNTHFNKIESIYFDSEKFDFYYDHIFQAKERSKLRLRKYGSNGIFNEQDPYFLEVKTKVINENNSVSQVRKSRFYLSHGQLEDLYNENFLMMDEECRMLNKALSDSDLLKMLKKVNKLLMRFHPTPSVLVTFERRAFEKEGFRVTCDEALQFTSLSEPEISVQNEYTNRINGFDSHLIVELKHNGKIPSWIQDHLTDKNVHETDFSKYCYSISQAVRLKQNNLEKI